MNAKKIIFPLLFLLNINNYAFGKLNPVDPNLRYDQACYLTSHNSYSTPHYGFYIAPQQQFSITSQLKDSGVRALELDTYTNKKGKDFKKFIRPAGKKPNKVRVVLSHGPLKDAWAIIWMSKVAKWLGGKRPPKLSVILKDIDEFLQTKGNEKEIVTIQLENHCTLKQSTGKESSDNEILDYTIKKSPIAKYVLTPSAWNPKQKNGWPILKWMVNNNKRIVIFNSTGASKYCYNYYDNILENKVNDKSKGINLDISKQEGSPRGQFLFSVKLFASDPWPMPVEMPRVAKINSNDLHELLNDLYKNGFINNKLKNTGIFKGRRPNFININFVNLGKPLPITYVNQYNEEAKKALEASKTDPSKAPGLTLFRKR